MRGYLLRAIQSISACVASVKIVPLCLHAKQHLHPLPSWLVHFYSDRINSYVTNGMIPAAALPTVPAFCNDAMLRLQKKW